MGSGVSVPSPTTQCEPSTAFSIQFSGSANASWDGQWVGLVSRPSGNAGYIQPVPEAEAATFFMDPNQVLYSADLATMDYAASQPGLGLDCLLFEPSNTVLPPFYNTADLKISSANTLQSLTKSAPTDPDFVILRDFDCIAEMDGPDIGVLDPMLFTNITLNVVNTGTCPGNICKQLPAGQGPVPYPDTPADFLNFSDFSDAATNAGTPVGYQKTFTNLKAANNANGYLGYSTFSTYDVVGCSQKCNSIVGCQAFNIYYERDPKVEPGSGDNCSNPPSTTTIKCSFWGGPVTQQNAVNAGQWRKNFQIVIAGSNGYVNNAIAPISGYNSAAYYGNSIIVPPATDCSSANPTLAWQFYNDGAPFSAARCAAACDAYSAQASLNATNAGDNSKPILCNYFNTFILNKGNQALGQMCYLYSQAFKSSRATATKQVDTAGNTYSYSFSYGFARSGTTGSCGANY